MAPQRAKGGKAGGKGRQKRSKSKREWALEGGAFRDDENAVVESQEDLTQDGQRIKRRRVTQTSQDQKCRSHLRSQLRNQQLAFERKFNEAQLARLPPRSAPKRKVRRGKRKRIEDRSADMRASKDRATLVSGQGRYDWVHTAVETEDQTSQEGGVKIDGYTRLVETLSKARREDGGNTFKRKEHFGEEFVDHTEDKDEESGEDGSLSAGGGFEGYEDSSKEVEESQSDASEAAATETQGQNDLLAKVTRIRHGAEDSALLSNENVASGAGIRDVSNGKISGDNGYSLNPENEDVMLEENLDAEVTAEDSFVRHWDRSTLGGRLEEQPEGAIKTLGRWRSGKREEAGRNEVVVQGQIGSEECLLDTLRPEDDLTLRPMLRRGVAARCLGSVLMARRLWPFLRTYTDVLFGCLTQTNLKHVQRVIACHLLDHLLKARGRVLAHNLRRRKQGKKQRVERLSKAVDAAVREEEATSAEDSVDGQEVKGGQVPESREVDRDQGYTRPRVLLLCSMRHVALHWVELMLALLGPQTAVSGMQRLKESYGVQAEDDKQEAEGRARKPEDWQRMFDGNCDDDFRLGIALTPGQGKGKGPGKGVAVKLYADFYHSDLIIASPLGLRLAMEAQKDADFLSSIEICHIDQADILYMQNWEHVKEVLRVLNKSPRADHGTDFSRVRHYVLEGQAARFRQNLVTSRWLDPCMMSAYHQYCQSLAGSCIFKWHVEDAFISQVTSKVKQVFTRIPCTLASEQGDSRFTYLTSHVLPEMRNAQQFHTLIFIPSYYDFVRLRNYAVRDELSHVCVSEYERVSETNRSRARFFHGQRQFMLYTGRAHFFRRFLMRGAHHVVFYSLPECPHFYPELTDLLREAEARSEVTSCLVLFTKYEVMALERIVGSKRARYMISSDTSTFLFC